MRFLVAECTGPTVVRWLEEQGHEVFSVYDSARGSRDDEIMRWANEERWILITNDRDSGEKIFRESHPHRGVIFSDCTTKCSEQDSGVGALAPHVWRSDS